MATSQWNGCSLCLSLSDKLTMNPIGLFFCCSFVLFNVLHAGGFNRRRQIHSSTSGQRTSKKAFYDPANDSVVIDSDDNQLSSGYLVELGVGHFIEGDSITGWPLLEIQMNDVGDDTLIAYAAGKLEAILTTHLIADYVHNRMADFCVTKNFCKNLTQFLSRNMNHMKKQISLKRSADPFWHQTGLMLEQLTGLQDGFKGIESQPRMAPSIDDLLFVNLDFLDLDYVVDPDNASKEPRRTMCSAIIKILDNSKDLYVGHNTWSPYSWLNRLIKNYYLPYHETAARQRPIKSAQISFSSYPALLWSGDDFYILSSGLTVIETSLSNYNFALYNQINHQCVLVWIRSMVANRLASNGSAWAAAFAQHNSGTYNNQWMIVDYKLFRPHQQLNGSHGLLTVVEQLPLHVISYDLTAELIRQSYYASYNLPCFEMIYYLSKTDQFYDKYGDYFSYTEAPRARIFKRDQHQIVDFDSMINLMRYNDYLNDPLSQCLNCTPNANPVYALASRFDLLDRNGVYPFSEFTRKPEGALDAKFTSYHLQKGLQMVAILGPPFDDVPPFNWVLSGFDTPHVGQPIEFKFEPLRVNWSWVEQNSN